MGNREVKELEKESTKHFRFIEKFVEKYCKNAKEKKEFFEELNFYLDTEINLEKWCNQ